MILQNKLNIKSEIELAREEERISKLKAKKLYESGFFDTLKAGSFESLSIIHFELFGDIYDFAGKIRNVNISKGNFRFAPITYLEEAIKQIESMNQSTFDEIHMRRFQKNIKKIVIKTLKIIKNKINEEQIKSFDTLMMANQFWSSIYSFIIPSTVEFNVCVLSPDFHCLTSSIAIFKYNGE